MITEQDLARKIASATNLSKFSCQARWEQAKHLDVASEKLMRDAEIGIELEIDKQNDFGGINLEAIKESLDTLPYNWAIVQDGSVSNGAEINTCPISVREWRNSRVAWYKAMKRLVKHKMRGHESGACGIHVHIKRSILEETEWRKLRTWICTARPMQFLKKLSRRGPEGGRAGRDPFYFCAFIDNQDSRYRALNLENNYGTAEWRFWRSTLKPYSFFLSIETSLLLPYWWKEVKNKKRKTLNSFIKFCSDKGYPITAAGLDKTYQELWPKGVGVSRRKLTPEEAKARKDAIALRKEQRLLAAREWVTRVIDGRLYSVFWTGDRPRTGATIQESLVPIRLAGTWNAAAREVAMDLRLPIKHIGSIPEGVYIRAHRTLGWGRSSISVSVSGMRGGW
jgi:hypothetical protein